ncbi:MAG: thiamine ABC transporter substrate-binding protein [Candidatus Thermoplasmatota archaeon]
MTMLNARALPLLLLLIPAFAGCLGEPAATSDCWKDATPQPGPGNQATRSAARVHDPKAAYQALGFVGSDSTGNDAKGWPDLHGAKVVVLDHGAFDYAFGPAKAAFEALTNGTVEHIAAQDAGSMLERAIAEKGRPSFDVLYGLDNVLYGRAVAADILVPYRPLLAPRIDADYLFADPNGPWLATPVDHGYIAVNADPRTAPATATLADLVPAAGKFVTQDPRTSSVGLGFLVATVAVFGEACYLGYWSDLLENGALVTADWTTAYATRFSGGYGQGSEGFVGDKSIVASYTTSPAYEQFYENPVLNRNILQPGATFHQIQTMALVQNGPNSPAAAQAWIEFTLSDAFQALAAEYNAIYPVVDGITVSAVYAGKDPAPGSFQDAGFTAATLGEKAEGWVRAWTAVYEASQA